MGLILIIKVMAKFLFLRGLRDWYNTATT